jgi:general secretion pathway protein G
MKKAFTMIELIFVIVILGILAAVAIPKLMATRTDAKISAISQEVSSIMSEIPAYVTAKGYVDSNITNMSQVAKTMEDQGQAVDDNSTGSLSGRIDSLIIKAPKDDGTLEDCIVIDVNSTTMEVYGVGTGTICKGVKARIKDGNYTIAGSSVNF